MAKIDHMCPVPLTVSRCLTTAIKPHWLEHLWDHGNLFGIWVKKPKKTTTTKKKNKKKNKKKLFIDIYFFTWISAITFFYVLLWKIMSSKKDVQEDPRAYFSKRFQLPTIYTFSIIFEFSGLDIKDYFDKSRVHRFKSEDWRARMRYWGSVTKNTNFFCKYCTELPSFFQLSCWSFPSSFTEMWQTL